MKYKIWLDIWLKNYVKPISKTKTYATYSYLVSTHINNALGELELKKVTLDKIQNFVTYLLNFGNQKKKTGLSSSTVNSVITVIQSSLKVAFTLGKIKVYQGQEIRRPKMVQKQVLSFSKSEQQKMETIILKEKKEEWFGFLIGLYTGLRLGELLALTWKDIDLKKRLIFINKTCFYGKSDEGTYQRFLQSPKTNASNRIIPFPKQLLFCFKEKKERYTSPYVVTKNNAPISIRNYQRIFTLFLQKLSIPQKGFHSLRHTFATRALECGMDVKTLSELLGHKAASITLNLYAHSFLEHKKQMMDRLGNQITIQ